MKMDKKNKNQKLREHEVREIKILLKKGLSISVLAEIFGVHNTTISSIKFLRSWKEVKV